VRNRVAVLGYCLCALVQQAAIRCPVASGEAHSGRRESLPDKQPKNSLTPGRTMRLAFQRERQEACHETPMEPLGVFRFGIVFFSRDRARQHYTLRGWGERK